MDALQPSFMLLPDFTFLPNGEVTLGRVVPISKDKKLPDPRRLLTARIEVDAARVSPFDHGVWEWNSDDSFNAKGGVWADLSVLTGIGAGLDGKYGRTAALEIKSHRVTQETFIPTPDDITKVLQDDTVSKILKKFEHPPVYLVTGRMIAEGAEITVKRGHERGGGAHASADLTSTGAPLNTGVKGDISQSQSRKLVQAPKGSFILAYQLLRLRKRRLGSIEDVPETKWALFSDEQPVLSDGLSAADLDIDVLTAEMVEARQAT